MPSIPTSEVHNAPVRLDLFLLGMCTDSAVVWRICGQQLRERHVHLVVVWMLRGPSESVGGECSTTKRKGERRGKERGENKESVSPRQQERELMPTKVARRRDDNEQVQV